MSRKRHKSTGGRAGGTDMKVSGNPNVFKEAADKKRGGKCRATGGAVAGVGSAPASQGTSIGRMSGGAVKARMDRPGRKKGGRVGADNSPLSTAHNTCSAPSAPGNNANSN